MTRTARFKRRVDRRFYRALYALYRRLFPSAAPAGPARPAAVRRMLVARTDRVGDAVVLTPALSYLRAVLPPDAEVDVVTSAAESLLRGDPRVHRVFVPAPGWLGWLRLVRALRARRYDVVLSVRLHDHLAEGLTAALAAPRGAVRATVRRPAQHAGLFTHQLRVPRARRHMRDRLLHLARGAVGGSAPGDAASDSAAAAADRARYPASLVRDATADARAAAVAAAGWGGRPFVALNAWGSDARRCFGPTLTAEIAAGIAARYPGLAVVLTPPPAALAQAEAVARDAAARLAEAPAPTGSPGTGPDGASPDGAGPNRGPRVAVAPPSADLRDLVALLRRAAVVVTPDTANMHIASAVGTPLVAVYSSYTAVDLWGAWGAQPRRVLYYDDGRPLREVPAADVLEALGALLPHAPA